MKTEQALMRILCVMCGGLVLAALVALVIAQLAPADTAPLTVQNLPGIVVYGG